jgi:hypothetical protein
MSAFPLKAEVPLNLVNVGFVPIADIGMRVPVSLYAHGSGAEV